MHQFNTSLISVQKVYKYYKTLRRNYQSSSFPVELERVTPDNSPKVKCWKLFLQQVKENTSLGEESVTDLTWPPAR